MSLVVAGLMAVIGLGLTTWMADRLRFEERVAIGIVVGVVAVNVVTFLVFLAVGMGWPALLLGLAVPGCPAAVGGFRRRSRLRAEISWAGRRLRQPARRSTSLRPFLAFVAAAGAVSTRVLSLSYQSTPEAMRAGSLAVWSDWAAHLAYAGSFAYGDNRALELPTASGTGFRYHFLADFAGAVFTVPGATLPQGLVLSAWMLAVALPALGWCAMTRLTRSRLTAALTQLLFLLSGGLGAFYFARDVARDGWGIVGTLPQTYARIPEQHLWVDNTISASFYAQRSTQLGFAVGLAALILVLAARPAWSRRGFVSAGLLLGVLGIGHAHMLLTGLALGGLAWAVDRRRTWWAFLAPAAAIGLPLAWAIAPQTNSIRILLGWMAPAAGQSWPWFWLRNVGLLLPLWLGIALLGGGLSRLRRLTTPLWLWFVVPNVVAFHPSEWNNTKYFLFWQLGGCLVIGSWLAERWRRAGLARTAVGVATRVGVAVVVVVMVSAGGLDAVRAMQRTTSIPWADADDLAAAEWLRDNSDAGEVIVHGMSNSSAVAALSGRLAVSGYIGWTYDLGVPDWSQRWNDVRTILSGAPEAEEAISRYGVDLVVIGPRERSEHLASDAYWSTVGVLVYERGAYRIYRTR